MWRMSYRNRLQRDLESWNSSGWVSEEGCAAILGSLDNEGGSHLATRAFILMGVLLFGSGVISFFASNWQEMSKLLKLDLASPSGKKIVFQKVARHSTHVLCLLSGDGIYWN